MKSKDRKKYLIIGIIISLFFVLSLLLHKDLFMYSDDIVFYRYLDNFSVAELARRAFSQLSGKMITDTAGALLTRIPLWQWSIIDSLLWSITAFFLGDIFAMKFNPKGYIYYLYAALLLLLLPVYYLTSAGFIITSSNYVYTSMGVISTVWCIQKCINSGKQSVWMYLLVGVCSFYAGSQEQSAIVLLAIGLTYLISQIAISRNDIFVLIKRNDIALTAVSLLAAIFGLFLVFISPAHISRVKAFEGPFSVPGYAEWSLLDKLFAGYTSTAANFIYYQTLVFILFCTAIMILGYKSRNIIIKCISWVPLIFTMVFSMVFPTLLAEYPQYGYGMMNLKHFEGITGILNYVLPLMLYLLICAIILFSFERRTDAFVVLFVLTIGLGSRVMMGLSSTLYGSSFRTCIYLLLCLVVCIGIIFGEIYTKNRKPGYLLFSITTVLSVYMFVINMYLINDFNKNGVWYVLYGNKIGLN